MGSLRHLQGAPSNRFSNKTFYIICNQKKKNWVSVICFFVDIYAMSVAKTGNYFIHLVKKSIDPNKF